MPAPARRLVEAGAAIRPPGVQPASARAAHGDKVRARHAADPGLRERLSDGGRMGAAKRFLYLRRMTPAERADYDELRGKHRLPAAEALAIVEAARRRAA